MANTGLAETDRKHTSAEQQALNKRKKKKKEKNPNSGEEQPQNRRRFSPIYSFKPINTYYGCDFVRTEFFFKSLSAILPVLLWMLQCRIARGLSMLPSSQAIR